jgi:hypothetical protein
MTITRSVVASYIEIARVHEPDKSQACKLIIKALLICLKPFFQRFDDRTAQVPSAHFSAPLIL